MTPERDSQGSENKEGPTESRLLPLPGLQRCGMQPPHRPSLSCKLCPWGSSHCPSWGLCLHPIAQERGRPTASEVGGKALPPRMTHTLPPMGGRRDH